MSLSGGRDSDRNDSPVLVLPQGLLGQSTAGVMRIPMEYLCAASHSRHAMCSSVVLSCHYKIDGENNSSKVQPIRKTLRIVSILENIPGTGTGADAGATGVSDTIHCPLHGCGGRLMSLHLQLRLAGYISTKHTLYLNVLNSLDRATPGSMSSSTRTVGRWSALPLLQPSQQRTLSATSHPIRRT